MALRVLRCFLSGSDYFFLGLQKDYCIASGYLGMSV